MQPESTMLLDYAFAFSQNGLIRKCFALCSWLYFHGCFSAEDHTQKKDPSPLCCWSEHNRCCIRALAGIVPLLGALQLRDSAEEMILCNLHCNCFCADTLSEEQQSTMGSITRNNDWFPAGLAQDKSEQGTFVGLVCWGQFHTLWDPKETSQNWISYCFESSGYTLSPGHNLQFQFEKI